VGNDPQIAASASFLVATTNGTITFLTKAGKLATDGSGNTINPILASLFFQPFFNPNDPNNLNTALNLPAGLKCAPRVSLYDGDPNKRGNQPLTDAQKAATQDCLKQFYDSRVMFDDFRKRFWIVTAVRNDSASHYASLSDVSQHVGRRTKLLVAVSVNQDPRAGWWMYAWDGEVDSGACTDVGAPLLIPQPCPGTQYTPGDAADYPSIGISKDYFVTTINVTNVGAWGVSAPSYTNVTAVAADGLAQGGCTTVCGWSYGHLDLGFSLLTPIPLGTLHHTTQPAVQHDVAPQGYTLLASNYPELNAIVVLGFRKAEGAVAPPVHVAVVPLDALEASDVNELPQQPSASIPTPFPVRVGNLDAQLLKAVARGGNLFLTWMDCRHWDFIIFNPCGTTVRLAGIDAVNALAATLAVPFLDTVVGQPDFDDPSGAQVSAGNPAIEVNSPGDIVVLYNRSGTQTFLQVRYSTWLHGESSLRGGFTLQAGTSPYNAQPPPPGKSYTLNLDTGGITVDPKDGVGVWMMHGYSYPKSAGVGEVDFAIGKVLGSSYYDFSIPPDGIQLNPKKPKHGKRFEIDWKVANDGDRRSPGGSGTIALLRGGVRTRLGMFSVPALAAGATRRVRMTLILPQGLRPGQYDLELGLPKSGDEYATGNDVARRRLRIR